MFANRADVVISLVCMRSRLFPFFLFCLACLEGSSLLQAENHVAYLNSIKKIDVHTHVRMDAAFVRELLDQQNFKYLNVCVDSMGSEMTLSQRENARDLYQKYPRHYSWVTTFDSKGLFEPGWTNRTIELLKQDFENGAIGVKIWKNFGMEILNPTGEYVQIDDPILRPIFEFIAQENKTLLAHIGEPIRAWMPTYTTEEGIPRNYWANRPEYSFYDKPDKPSYSDIISAVDHVLRDHPNLRYVAAHLASLEFDVEEIALRMEKHPNFAVEIGGRTRYLMWQARGKVRAFFLKYQDRILYGTDMGAPANMSLHESESRKNRIITRNAHCAQYLATDDEIPWGDIISGDRPIPEASYSVTGLALPESVLKKIYYDNVVRWFPGVETNFTD